MIVSQRTAKIFAQYGFITLDPLYAWHLTKQVPSTSKILHILSRNPLHYKENVKPWIIDPTFGKTNIGANILANTLADAKAGSHYTLAENGWVSSITCYFKKSTPGTTNVRLLSYQDIAGSPAAKKSQGIEIVGADDTWAWRTANLSPSIYHSLAEYWLVIHKRNTVDLRYDAGAANSATMNMDVYADGASDPFGAVGMWAAILFSIYATYTVFGGGFNPGQMAKIVLGV